MRLWGGTLGGWRCGWTPTSGYCGAVRNPMALQRSHPRVCKHLTRLAGQNMKARGAAMANKRRWVSGVREVMIFCSSSASSSCFSVQEAQKR